MRRLLSAVKGGGKEGGAFVELVPKWVTRLLDYVEARGRTRFAIHHYVDCGEICQINKGTISMVWSQLVGSQEIGRQE